VEPAASEPVTVSYTVAGIDGKPVTVSYTVPGFLDDWVLRWEKVPESSWHADALDLLKIMLVMWIARTGRDAAVYRDIAIRVRKDKPNIGFNPDIGFFEPAPPDRRIVESVRLWAPGHYPPTFAIEVVSKNHPHKDYVESPEKCAAAGVRELAVFNPLHTGRRGHGGRKLLKLWRRQPDGGFRCVSSGSEPAFSEVLGVWLIPDKDERLLLFSDDPAGQKLWELGTQNPDLVAAVARISERLAKTRHSE
jgi:Uma2 family endonuclease